MVTAMESSEQGWGAREGKGIRDSGVSGLGKWDSGQAFPACESCEPADDIANPSGHRLVDVDWRGS
jgi:hypothetical protein